MDLLRYEFIAGPDGSINGMLRKLVTELRYNRSNIPAEQFRAALPALREIEKTLQDLDAKMGEGRRNYIEEIMTELDKEFDDASNIQDELFACSHAIIGSFIPENNFDFASLDFNIGKGENYYWLRFSGYTDKRPIDANLILARDAFRAICSKYNYVFIDLS